MTSIHKVFTLREDRNAMALYAFLNANWKSLAEKGKPLVLEISEERSKRSKQANAFYWAVTLKQISEQGWVDGKQFAPAVWHEHFRDLFCPRIDKPFGGTAPCSTTEMDVETFNNYVRQVEAWAAQELGVEFLERM